MLGAPGGGPASTRIEAGSEVLPELSSARTSKELMPGIKLVMWYWVCCVLSKYTSLLSITYPETSTSSLDANQDSVTESGVLSDIFRFPGTLGAVVSLST
ncbi:hypothetical protein D3C75_1072160 [compost metagenome]